jgi:hypothetical protein
MLTEKLLIISYSAMSSFYEHIKYNASMKYPSCSKAAFSKSSTIPFSVIGLFL